MLSMLVLGTRQCSSFNAPHCCPCLQANLFDLVQESLPGTPPSRFACSLPALLPALLKYATSLTLNLLCRHE